jgi:hypothetical protein
LAEAREREGRSKGKERKKERNGHILHSLHASPAGLQQHEPLGADIPMTGLVRPARGGRRKFRNERIET